ncbi:MAG: hypothetical protein U5M23_09200 [Marinagarivorans sp.]|nr:hypothetical protein [Marinagarivorans sp.]
MARSLGARSAGAEWAATGNWACSPTSASRTGVEFGVLHEGPGAAVTAAVLDGILVNWDATYAIYGGSVLLRREELAVG